MKNAALIYIFDGDELVDVMLDESSATRAVPQLHEREIARIVKEWKQLKEAANYENIGTA